MSLADTHAHLHDRDFDHDVDAVVQRAASAGVTLIVTLGTDVASSERTVWLAERVDGVVAAVGVHPHEASSFDEAGLARLRELASHPKVVAVGEIGLDFYRNLSPRADQLRAFQRQLDWAAEARLPVAIHSREAHEAMEPIVARWAESCGRRLPGDRPLGVMHYFSGAAALALRYVELGFVISIHTSVTYPNSRRLGEVARAVPLEWLVLETDSPYGAPQAYRGRRNEPAYVAQAALKVAELRGIHVQEVERVTTQTALRLFGLEAEVA